MPRYLIVNADDFGLAGGVNAGIVRGHECGIVTSASLMACGMAATEAAALAAKHPNLSVGLHIDLGEWVLVEGKWVEAYHVVDNQDEPAVRAEVQRQLKRFQELMGRSPTHLDSHQHAHRAEPAKRVMNELADELTIPLRHNSRMIQYCGKFYGHEGAHLPGVWAVSVENLIQILSELPEGISELACHPAESLSADVPTPYREGRRVEMETLCDPTIRAALKEMGISLISFNDVGLIKR